MTFNPRKEVETILGRAMTTDEAAIFLIVRNYGMANPFDIIAQFSKK